MIISLDELANSKTYVGKNEAFNFQNPMYYAEPFVKLMEPLGATVRVQVEAAVTNAENDTDVRNTAYGRVSVIAKLPALNDIYPEVSSFNKLQKELGFIYAFDTTKPELKVFSGSRVEVCMNQTVFGSDNIMTILFQSGKNNALYEQIEKYVARLEKDRKMYLDTVKYLADQQLNNSQLKEQIGEIFWYAKQHPKLGMNAPSGMLDLIMDTKNPLYYVNGDTNKWHLYNAMTQVLNKSSVLDNADKVLTLEKLFMPNGLN